MKKGWFEVGLVDKSEINGLYYQDSLITRVWITKDEIGFRTDNISNSFGKNKSVMEKNGSNGYEISVVEFNKLKAHLEEIIGITEEKLLEGE